MMKTTVFSAFRTTAAQALAVLGGAAVFACAPSAAAQEASWISIWDDVPQQAVQGPLEGADPASAKGGTVHLGALGAFDNFNPFAPRGISAGYTGLTYQTLGTMTSGDALVARANLARSFDVAPDRLSMTVKLHEKAKFSDGMPVTAQDVKFTFYALTTKASPTYRSYYKDVTAVDVIDTHTVKFTFSDARNRELPLIVAQLPVVPAHWWKDRNIGEPQKEAMPGSGPYRYTSFKMGSQVVLEKVPNWWGSEVAVSEGRFNFDRIEVDYYRDSAVMKEAFFAGEIDYYPERTIKDWVKGYDVPAVRDGRIVKKETATKQVFGMSGIFMNTRRSALSDIRVRQALSLMFDFEWTNRALFHGAYTRCDSFFSGSDNKAADPVTPEERELIAKLCTTGDCSRYLTLPAPVRTDGSGNIRPQMREALKLLREAGFTLRNGKLTDAQGRQLTLSLIYTSASMSRVYMPFANNLSRIGIELRPELIDQAQYVNRVRSFQYDLMHATIRQSSNPGNEQRNYWGSAAAGQNGTRNYSGLQNPFVDALIELVAAPESHASQLVAARTLDRVLRNEVIAIPAWYSTSGRYAYWQTKISPSARPTARGVDLTSWHAVRTAAEQGK